MSRNSGSRVSVLNKKTVKNDELKIIHSQTIIQTTFMLVDKDGDCIDKRVVEGEIRKLDIKSFSTALNMLCNKKVELEKEVKNASRTNNT